MVKDELVTVIKEKFLQGERRHEIKENLREKGFSERDIDAAIAKIQHDAVKQLPAVAWIYQQIEYLEEKYNLTTTRMTVLLMIACIILLLLLAGGLYLFFDPLGTRSVAQNTPTPVTSGIPVIPTATPVPPFVPQSAGGDGASKAL